MVIGLGEAAARPVRAILTLVAIFVGVATVVVALGETRSFAGIFSYEGQAGNVDVVVTKSAALPDSDAMQLITSQPETTRVVAQAFANITVPGIGDPVQSTVFRGDSQALGYLLTAGRWINGPGEVVAPRGLLQDAHLRVGDTFTGTFHGAALKLHVVGEVYDFVSGPGGYELILDWSTIAAVAPDLAPDSYLVTLKPGSDVAAFVKRLAATQPDLLDVQASNTGAGIPDDDRRRPVGNRGHPRADCRRRNLQYLAAEHAPASARHRHPQGARYEPRPGGLDNGLLLYSRRQNAGRCGDWLLVAPPLVIDEDTCGELVERLDGTLSSATDEVLAAVAAKP